MGVLVLYILYIYINLWQTWYVWLPNSEFPNSKRQHSKKKSSYGVFIGGFLRYARACTYYEDFKQRTLPLVSKLKKQFFKSKLLKSTWIKFCDSHILLIQKYGPKVMFLYDEWMWFWRTKSIDIVTIFLGFWFYIFLSLYISSDGVSSHVSLIIDLLSGRGKQAMAMKA